MNETCLLLLRNSQAKDTKVSQKLPYSMMSTLKKEMATHSSILAWRILCSEEPGGLLSLGLHRVGHDWRNLACMCALEKEMATTPVLLPGESQGQRSLVGCRLWSHTESDNLEAAAWWAWRQGDMHGQWGYKHSLHFITLLKKLGEEKLATLK